MISNRVIACTVLVSLCLFTATEVVFAQKRSGNTAKDPFESATLEFSLSAEELEELTGQTFDLLFKTGKKETGVVIEEFLRHKQLKDRFRTIEYQVDGKNKTTKLAADKVFQIENESVVYEVAYLPIQKYCVLVDVKRRNEAIAAKLAENGNEFWKPLSEDEQKKAVDEGKEFLTRVAAHFGTLPLLPYETEYFLFLSDLPAAQLKPYIQQLDKMNEALGQAYGFAPGHNVWRGKAIVVLFMNEASYVEFEQTFMNYDPTGRNTQGLCHSIPDGRVIVSCYRGNSPEFLGVILVHETAHGYNFRYKSNADIPLWLDEGISDWIASVAVPASGEVSLRQREAADYLRTTGTFGGMFFETPAGLERWQYGAGSAIVQLMVKKSPQLFQLFYNGIKDGLTWQDSLMRSYGITPEELTRAYGQTIGVPNLTP